MKPYWEDEDAGLTLYLGDMREVLPALAVTADLIVADPPYGETTLEWDRWPDGWLDVAAQYSRSMWCFGSQRMFLKRAADFQAAGWELSQDIVGRDEDGEPIYGDVNVVWEKRHGTGFATDRFKRVHEHALHWYRGGNWRTEIHHNTPKVAVSHRTKANAGRGQVPHTGKIGSATWVDDGTRLMRSVIQVPSMWRRGAIHPTEKPVPLVDPLIRYACPPGGLVVDPFSGSGSTLDAARQAGRPAIGIEANEKYAERTALRLSALTLPAA